MPKSKFVHLIGGSPCTSRRQNKMSDSGVHFCDDHDRRTVLRDSDRGRLAVAQAEEDPT